MPDAIFWASTPRELQVLVGEMVKREGEIERTRQKAMDYRVRFIAAQIMNQWVPKGKKPYTADDFVKKERSEDDMYAAMRSWAAKVNRRHNA